MIAWTPDTHKITFYILKGRVVSYETEDQRLRGLEPQEAYDTVVRENQAINTLLKSKEEIDEIKVAIEKGEAEITDYVI